MNILYFFQEKETPMYQWQRIHFIDELERHGCRFTFINPLSFSTADEANDALVSQINNGNYDLFLTNICYHKALFKETVSRIKEKGVATLNFRSDNLTIPFFDKEVGPSFDLLWLTSKETQYLYERWGVNTMFAPYAANPYFFTYQELQMLNRRVCFIGTPYGSRPIMINTLSSNSIPVDVYYKRNEQLDNSDIANTLKSDPIVPSNNEILFKRLLFPQGRKVILGSFKRKYYQNIRLIDNPFMYGHPKVMSEEQPVVYGEHVLSLSSTASKSTDVLRKPLDVINLRAFEIPMSGGIELCKYNKELSEYFEEDKEIVFYKDNNELVDKARFYTERASDSLIRRMKQAARARAEHEHTWWNRFLKAFDRLGLNNLITV